MIDFKPIITIIELIINGLTQQINGRDCKIRKKSKNQFCSVCKTCTLNMTQVERKAQKKYYVNSKQKSKNKIN